MKKLIAFILSSVSCLGLAVQPWEAEDISSFPQLMGHQKTAEQVELSNVVSQKLIGWYQKQNAEVTVSKCPFHISCSNYAKQAIQKYDFYPGLCFFFDRFFFRENKSMYAHYPFTANEQGVLKLKDDFYLYGDLKY